MLKYLLIAFIVLVWIIARIRKKKRSESNYNEPVYTPVSRPAPVYKPDLDSCYRMFAGAVSSVRSCSSVSDEFQYAYIKVTKNGANDYSVLGKYDHCANAGVREGLNNGYNSADGFSKVNDGFVFRQNNVKGNETSFSQANIKAFFSARNTDAYCETAIFENDGKSIYVCYRFRS